MDEAVKQEVVELLLEGRKIEAIKRIREETGWGLTDAKEHAERMQTELRGATPSVRNLDKRSGCSGVLLLALVVLAGSTVVVVRVFVTG